MGALRDPRSLWDCNGVLRVLFMVMTMIDARWRSSGAVGHFNAF